MASTGVDSSESLAAGWNGAEIRFFTGMCEHMSFEVFSIGAQVVTLLAFKTLLVDGIDVLTRMPF